MSNDVIVWRENEMELNIYISVELVISVWHFSIYIHLYFVQTDIKKL